MIRVKCKKDYGISLKKDEIYSAKRTKRPKLFFAVYDETKEWYAFPVDWFEKVEEIPEPDDDYAFYMAKRANE